MESSAAFVMTGSMTWQTPPGYKGPIAVAPQNYNVPGPSGMIGPWERIYITHPGEMFNTGSFFNKNTIITWWPNIAAYQIFNSAGTWTAPPGYNGPILLYDSSGVSGAVFNGITLLSAVQPALVSANNTYSLAPSPGNSLTVVYWP